ncbi:zinc finger protein 346 [Austrofundulus limnaeus]|nr:PREDICTED: zinc finger protein 346-like [Austrofundulus limnaeus]
MAKQHYEGKKHKKLMTRLKLIETYGPSTAAVSSQNGYSCTICNIVLNSVEQYQSHISGARHKNQMKKSGLKPAEDQHPAEQPQGGANQHTPADNQCSSAEDWHTSAEDGCAPLDDECAPLDDEFAQGDGQYDAGDGQYAATEQYTQEYTEFSEQFQYA